MADVTATMIKEVRERTGVGMGKCKQALVEANGNIEDAISLLRKQGMASAAKKQSRQTKEGMIGAAETDGCIAIVEAGSETDFVIQNERFQQFLKNMAEEVAQSMPADLSSFLNQKYSKEPDLTIEEYRGTIVQTIGENIEIKRIHVLPKAKDHSYGIYSHLNGKILVVVEIAGSEEEEELAKNIAMHTAAASPEYVSPEQVPSEILDREREIAKEQMKGKPENIMEKIVEGKINAYYDEVCLTHQAYIRDDKQSVGQVVEARAKETGKPLKLINFIRWAVVE